MTNEVKNIDKNFGSLVATIGAEISHAQVRVVHAANVQMLMHYWKLGYIITNYQDNLGWGSKVIEQISKVIKSRFPEKKGYSTRNLQYMCQFAKQYNIDMLEKMVEIDTGSKHLTVEDAATSVRLLNEFEFAQEAPAQIQISSDKSKNQIVVIAQEPLAQIDNKTLFSPVAGINWASHVIIMNSKLPIGKRYWYMKQALENGWSSNVLSMQIKSGLYERQIHDKKVTNFIATLPASKTATQRCRIGFELKFVV